MKRLFLMLVGGVLGSGLAFSPLLTPAQIQAALEQGQQMVQPNQGYLWKGYVLKEYSNGLDLVPTSPEVDAVVVGTPYERLRFKSYRSTYEGTPLTLAQAEGYARQYGNQLEFMVFAHSMSPEPKDQGFLERFSSATLRIPGHGTLHPSQTDRFGPAQDFYNIQGRGHEFRWLGYVSYTFDLSALARRGLELANLKATLTFKDASGKLYTLPVNLANYQ
ncbi:MAG: hypothetical protein K6T57_03640 [Thermaceae bacterium]|nr:hypothetical protein [Thermaceae bacterium]